MKRTVFITYVKRGGDCKGSSRKRWIVKKSKLSMEQRKIRTKSRRVTEVANLGVAIMSLLYHNDTYY